jgi:adenylate cyclase
MTQRVVDQVLQRQDDLLFGSACTASVLFADIRNFTSMAESLRPRETVDMLNEVFTDLVEAVSGHDGVLDKFIGDAVMAVYGAPLSSGRDPENAVESAIAMMRLLALLNERRPSGSSSPCASASASPPGSSSPAPSARPSGWTTPSSATA